MRPERPPAGFFFDFVGFLLIFWCFLGPRRGPQIDKKLKKRVPEFGVFFGRVPKPTSHSSGGQNGTRSGAESVQNPARAPKRRIFANMLNLLRLPRKSRVRASTEIDKKWSLEAFFLGASFSNRFFIDFLDFYRFSEMPAPLICVAGAVDSACSPKCAASAPAPDSGHILLHFWHHFRPRNYEK